MFTFNKFCAGEERIGSILRWNWLLNPSGKMKNIKQCISNVDKIIGAHGVKNISI